MKLKAMSPDDISEVTQIQAWGLKPIPVAHHDPLHC